MARGRFISATLGGSRKFARLANDRHRMIYQLLIPSADAYGRIDADPITLGGRVLTRLGIAPDEISAALADMHEVGLIHLYLVGEDQYAEIINFHEHNDIDLSREAQAEIPDARGVMPPKKPPRGTTRAAADPRAWSGEYVAANAHPTTEPDSTSPDTGSQVPHTANQRQSKTSAIRLEVEGEVEVEEEVLNPPTPQKPEPGPPQVEAQPRREVKKPNGEIEKAKPRGSPAVRGIDQPFVDAWNDNRGPLARILSVGKERERSFDRLRRELGDDALDIFRDAVRQVAREPYYRDKGLNIGHLLSGGDGKVLKWAEKWRSTGGMSNQDRRLAAKAQAVADAIGGLDAH